MGGGDGKLLYAMVEGVGDTERDFRKEMSESQVDVTGLAAL